MMLANPRQDVAHALQHRRAGAVNGGHAARLQKGVILRRDDAAGDNADIFPPPFFQRGDQLGDQGFVACRQR